MDRKLAILEQAHEAWLKSMYAKPSEKVELAKALNAHGCFSIRQIAKIVRMSPGALGRHISKSGIGGKFDPETLTALIALRKVVLTGEQLPLGMVRAVVKGGTTVSTLARLTGANHTTLYVKLKEQP